MENKTSYWYKKKQSINFEINSEKSFTIFNNDFSKIYVITKKSQKLNLIQFDLKTNFSEKKLLKIKNLQKGQINSKIDFSIQKIFYFNEKILLIKNSFKNEKYPFLLLNPENDIIYPILINLEFDILKNGIFFFSDKIYFFGGIEHISKIHNKFFLLNLENLEFQQKNRFFEDEKNKFEKIIICKNENLKNQLKNEKIENFEKNTVLEDQDFPKPCFDPFLYIDENLIC